MLRAMGELSRLLQHRLSRNSQLAAQQLRQQRDAQGGEGAGLLAVRVGAFEKPATSGVEGVENRRGVGHDYFQHANYFGANGGIRSAVGQVPQLREYFIVDKCGVDE